MHKFFGVPKEDFRQEASLRQRAAHFMLCRQAHALQIGVHSLLVSRIGKERGLRRQWLCRPTNLNLTSPPTSAGCRKHELACLLAEPHKAVAKTTTSFMQGQAFVWLRGLLEIPVVWLDGNQLSCLAVPARQYGAIGWLSPLLTRVRRVVMLGLLQHVAPRTKEDSGTNG